MNAVTIAGLLGNFLGSLVGIFVLSRIFKFFTRSWIEGHKLIIASIVFALFVAVFLRGYLLSSVQGGEISTILIRYGFPSILLLMYDLRKFAHKSKDST